MEPWFGNHGNHPISVTLWVRRNGFNGAVVR